VLKPGVYPASVTPFTEKGAIDMAATARLLAWFEACGCTGAVLAGTNGEGPSLSATEKRDLVREAMPLRGKLDIILGIASSSLEEAVWLSNQALKSGAVAALVMPPSYFREASEDGIVSWFVALMDRTDMPIIVYNFPQRTGITITPTMLQRIAEHDQFAGVKDSSGARENLSGYASALDGSAKALYVGNETLLLEALQNGWTGTISGASNVMPYPLSCIVRDWHDGKQESAEAKFKIALPAIEALRGKSQPATNKALLESIGVIPSGSVRLPLTSSSIAEAHGLRAELEKHLGPLDAQSKITVAR
jgi:4-hydroxy-tetrahydrodipicolinate synthase